MTDLFGSASAPVDFSRIRPISTEPAQAEFWEDRPVRVFHVREGSRFERRYVALGNGSEHQKGRLIRCLEVLGYQLSGIVTMQQDASIADFVWKRNFEWKSLPEISTPTFTNMYVHISILDEWGDRKSVPGQSFEAKEIVTSMTEVLVIAVSILDPYTLAQFARLTKGRSSKLRIMHFDGTDLSEVDPRELEAAEQFHSADARFVFNHAVNMMIVTSRAYLKVVRENGHTQRQVEVITPTLNYLHWRLGHPLCLQALFAIGKLGRPCTKPNEKIDFEHLPWLMTHSLPFFEHGEGTDRFIWKGTGKYSPWTIDLGPVTRGKVVDSQGVYVSPHFIFSTLRSLYNAGFISVYGEDVRITAAGERFLDLIGDAADDQDVLLRWRSNDLFGLPGDVRAMDRWLNTSFRAIKRRVANLPASPLAELVDVPWPPSASNVMHVWGRCIKLDGENFDEKAALLIQELSAYEAVTELKDRRFGIIHHHIGFGEPPLVKGIWVGVPVAITRPGSQAVAEVDLLKDWTSFGPIYDLAKAQLPDWLDLGDAEGLTNAGLTAMEVVNLHVPDKTHGFDATFPGTKVFFGKVFVIEDVAKCDQETRRYAGMQSMGRFLSSHTDGLWSFMCGRSVTFAYGALVGFNEKQSDKIFVQRALCSERSRAVTQLLNRLQDDWPAVFEQDVLSELGYWMITPSGSVEKIDPFAGADPRMALI